ncbi:hypothetical protein ABF87_01510 [Nitrosomonas sp. JL21]|nr:hypothetical protein [Nitrosomonas sp. JL21]
MQDVQAKLSRAKERSVHVQNEHFEPDFNSMVECGSFTKFSYAMVLRNDMEITEAKVWTW